MGALRTAVVQTLFAISSVALLNGSSCSLSYCSEDCDPCLTQCACNKTCHQALMLPFAAAHELKAFELVSGTNELGQLHQTLAWIAGLSVPQATGRLEIRARDLREFAEGVLGVNRELLDLDSVHGRWEFSTVELGVEFGVVSFTHLDPSNAPTDGRLEFVFDVRGRLLQIDRFLAHS